MVENAKTFSGLINFVTLVVLNTEVKWNFAILSTDWSVEIRNEHDTAKILTDI